MFEGVHHVGQIVDDIEETKAFYRDVLDGTITSCGSVDGKVDVAFVELPEYRTELICRHERGTYLDDLLDELVAKPESHVAFVVDDIVAAMETFEAADVPMHDEEPVEGLGPYVRAFVEPSEVPGTPIELVEERPAD
ncbi:VOC family protein [Halomarina halobia]|uniref:VOC family protein n=1 Tax=Halomarina halobia TaxID=3033386 RepID=A0ABD6AFY8_9EURY|nr:VOC family protein [Halomarina sp. PSR21]